MRVPVAQDTAAILRHLTELEDGPWAHYAHGGPLASRQLATLLAAFGIKAKQIRQGPASRKVYLRADCTDAFCRYLPPDPKHPKHRPGPAAFALQNEGRASGAVASGELAPTPPRRNVSEVSEANAD